MGKEFTQKRLSLDTYCESKENRPVPPNSDQVLYSDINLRLSGLWLFPV